MMRKQLLLFILLSFSSIVLAQNVVFETIAPSAVAKGDEFRIVYTLHNAIGSDARFADEIKGFDIKIGPSISRKQSSTSINGSISTASAESYIFIVKAVEEGLFTVPSASIVSGGKTYTSRPVKTRVLPADKSSNKGAGDQSSSMTTATRGVSDNDVLIRTIVSKTNLYEQEAFIITYRLYSRYEGIKDYGAQFPDFEGFVSKDLELRGNIKLTLESYNGRNYYAGDMKRMVVFPQRSGKIIIPEGKVELILSVPSGRRVQVLGGSQELLISVNKLIKVAPLTINVTALPTPKPSDFSNGVGSFSLKSHITATQIKANEPITLTLTIEGNGNLKLIKTPELTLPSNFEKYDPKISNNIEAAGTFVSGTKTIEYLFIPRNEGNYTIPPIEFSYFDINSKTYKTLRTSEYKLNIDKDPNAGAFSSKSYNNQSEVEVVKDIRFLKKGEPAFVAQNDFLIASFSYLLWYLIPMCLFSIGLIAYRNRIKQHADSRSMKIKKANKMAIKRLKTAETYLKAHNKEKFYEEMSRAVWGYLSDKLSIPLAELNRENIEQELSKYGVAQTLSSTYISILDTCEFARYAPTEFDGAMDKFYEEVVSAIGEMENVIKKKL